LLPVACASTVQVQKIADQMNFSPSVSGSRGSKRSSFAAPGTLEEPREAHRRADHAIALGDEELVSDELR
jgi:hypothetical protein